MAQTAKGSQQMVKTPLKKQKKSTRITENCQEGLHYKKSSYTDDHLKNLFQLLLNF